MHLVLRYGSRKWLLWAGCVVSFAAIPCALAVQPMTNESALGEGGKGEFGIGVGTGSVRAISIYKQTNDKNFVQLSGNLGNDESYFGTLDFCQRFTTAAIPFSGVVPYAGVGLVSLYQVDGLLIEQVPVTDSPSLQYGARLPLGINFNLPVAPVQLGAEIAPTLIMTPRTMTYVQGMVSARIMF